MKTRLITMYSPEWQDLANVVMPNLFKYCDRHDYGLTVKVIPAAYDFRKIKLILAALYAGEDLVLYMDADTYITNHNVKVEGFVDDDHDFYIAQDINEVNAGVLLVKNTDWSKWFLRFILSMADSYSNEQNVIEAGKDHSKIKILPHPSINSYMYDEYAPTWGLIPGWKPTTGSSDKPTHEQGDWRKGDFLLHMPGLPNKRRIDIIHLLKNLK